MKIPDADGKQWFTDIADTEELLRPTQSIPSPKIEPSKLSVASIRYERLEK